MTVVASAVLSVAAAAVGGDVGDATRAAGP